MTTPERIWATCTTPDAQKKRGDWHEYPYGTEYIRADLAAVPAQVKVKPLDLSNALKHAFITGRVSAGAASSFHADAWAEYDPTESAGYARILASIEPQPDPRDEVIARLVDAADGMLDAFCILDDIKQIAAQNALMAALAAAKAMLKEVKNGNS